ncbi:uncharacterized protein LOC115230942 [Octopus sinensis]|uniref:Uncharacterized protein LOC115230942 n=1 Tax=Octopus sinensis TaxID=2607531 RepID=A0A6P7U3Q1_9MOLL|nr:uncharacterized protein LOC115230942 [Octopus sinensis]
MTAWNRKVFYFVNIIKNDKLKRGSLPRVTSEEGLCSADYITDKNSLKKHVDILGNKDGSYQQSSFNSLVPNLVEPSPEELKHNSNNRRSICGNKSNLEEIDIFSPKKRPRQNLVKTPSVDMVANSMAKRVDKCIEFIEHTTSKRTSEINIAIRKVLKENEGLVDRTEKLALKMRGEDERMRVLIVANGLSDIVVYFIK